MTTPAAMTFDSLMEDISVYAERTDEPFMAQRARFIMMTENRLASEVRGLGFLRVVTTPLNGPNLVKPIRWRETKSFSVTIGSTVTYLQARGYQYCRSFNPVGVSGTPRYYSDEDYSNWFITPTAPAGAIAEIQYHERPEPLSSANQTNWTSQYAPQLLLYGTLLEAQPFLKLPERIPEFQALFDRALQMLAKEDQQRLAPDSAAVRK